MEFNWSGCLKKIARIGSRQDENRERPASESRPQKSVGAVKKSTILTRVLQPAHTIRLRPDRSDASLQDSASRTEVSKPLRFYGITDKGVVRDHNEDAFSILSFEDKSLFIVADGMGGHDAGEVASRLATETVYAAVREEGSRDGDPLELVERAVKRANKVVRYEGMLRGSDMGTTICVALVAGETAYIANVGDSRVYWMENGGIDQITKDHSLVAKLVEAGKLTKEEARVHPKSNLLYRTIGSSEEIIVDTFRIPVKKKGTLLLCSDGLWGEVTDDEIHRVCSAESDVQAIGVKLAEMANENGGKDNITAVVVKV
jgi:serine/threonine protein phosphatase PrpC